MKPIPNTCVAYIRVNPGAEPASVTWQEEAVARHAAARGLTIVDTYLDTCSGVTDPLKREAFSKALAALKAGSAAALVVRDLDRIARDMSLFASTIVVLRDLSIPIYFCGETEPFSFD